MRVAALGLDRDCGFDDGARLHFGNLWERDAETASTQSEHGILLMQFFHTSQKRAEILQLGRPWLALFQASDLNEQIFPLGQELVQRRIEQADGYRQRLHCLEQ